MSNLNLERENDPLYTDPFIFVDTLEGSKHIVMFYKNQDFGQKIQFRFIRNGLLKGENCIFTIYSDDVALIENDMIDNNIDVEEFDKKACYIFSNT